MKIDVVQLALKKQYTMELDLPCEEIRTASDTAPLFCREIGALNIEHAAMLSLDHTDRVINFFVIAMGEINTVRVPLEQMLKNALLSNASKIIIAHNHPSGILKVTSNDVEMTKKIAFFANAFSIELVDSLVVTADDYVSIRMYCKELMDE